jgi:hypothetical protein
MLQSILWAFHWNGGKFIAHTPLWSFKLRGPAHGGDYSEHYVASTKVVQFGRRWPCWRLVIVARPEITWDEWKADFLGRAQRRNEPR